jgi:catechol 2,3-dioxygenase-like lactoylglutathione lyase family enzyme
MRVERISAVTLTVASMRNSVRFYRDVLGFHPEIPRDASWGERYFHMSDPEGHELSFARPI